MELVEADKRDGRPKLTRTEVNIAAVADLVKNDRRIASRIFEHPQDCSSSDSQRGFGKEKVVCTFHSTPEQREDQVTSCQDIIMMADADKNFFNKIIMGDET